MVSRALLLLSGGIDSPVAGKLALTAGLPVSAIHFASKFIGRNPEYKCIDLARTLTISPLQIMNASPAFESIAKTCAPNLYFVLMKRFMLCCAEQLALREGYTCLITGESLGQVSSQTLSNLTVIQSAVSIPILRPLLALNKEQIVKLAKQFNTFDISVGPESCDILGSKHPSTFTVLDQIETEEKKLDYSKLISDCLHSLKRGV